MRRQFLMRPAWRALLAALAFGALVACETTPPTSPQPGLTAPAEMNGVTTATVLVRAPGAWQLTPLAPAGLAERLSLSANSGTGNATVTLRVDPAGLDPLPDYPIQLQLQAEGTIETAVVTFSFPDVHGRAVRVDATVSGLSVDLGGAAQAGAEALVLSPEGDGPAAASELDAAALDARAHELAAAPPADTAGPRDGASSEGTVTLMVGVAPLDGIGPASAEALSSLALAVAETPGAAIESRFDEAGIVFVEVPAGEVDEAVNRLAATSGVRYVEEPKLLYPMSNDPLWPEQWNMEMVEPDRLWPVTRGAGVTIAILDNGFYPEHEDLAGNVVGQFHAGTRRSSARSTRVECGTHGTHVAGIAAAVTDNGIGVAGTAPDAGLYLVNLDRNDSDCQMDTAALVRGLQHVIDGGSPRAEIINMSIGTSGPLGDATEAALQAARDAGIILIGAAGNTPCRDGQRTSNPVSYPAAYDTVWAVAAVDPIGQRACYSHIGSELFISAPGGDSSYWPQPNNRVISTEYDGDRNRSTYGRMQGTSMAAPMVSGVAALLLSAEPGATPSEIEEALREGAIPLGPHVEYGHGLVDAQRSYEALTRGAPPPPPPPPPPDQGLFRIMVPGYETTVFDPSRSFIIPNAPVGPLTIVVESDDDGNGVFGEPGEYRGEVTVNVAFDRTNEVVVHLEPQ